MLNMDVSINRDLPTLPEINSEISNGHFKPMNS